MKRALLVSAFVVAAMILASGHGFAQEDRHFMFAPRAWFCDQVLTFERWAQTQGTVQIQDNEQDAFFDYGEATGYIEGYLGGRGVTFPYQVPAVSRGQITLNDIWRWVFTWCRGNPTSKTSAGIDRPSTITDALSAYVVTLKGDR